MLYSFGRIRCASSVGTNTITVEVGRIIVRSVGFGCLRIMITDYLGDTFRRCGAIDLEAQRQRYAGRGINQEWLIAPERWSKMAPSGGMTTGALKSMKSELKSIANGSVFHERSCWAPTLNAGNVERRLPLVRLNSNLRLRSTFFHRLQSVVSWLALG